MSKGENVVRICTWQSSGQRFSGLILATAPVAGDTTPPTPNPLGWTSAPSADSETAISMEAETATDDTSSVEYRFRRYNDDGITLEYTSPWQISPSFTDSGLLPATTYGYTVQARDTSAAMNEGAESSPPTEATTPEDATPPTPNPLGWVSTPAADSETSISMTAETATDAEGNGVLYRFRRYNDDGVTVEYTSPWQSGPSFTDTGLVPLTTYGYTVQTRDSAYTPNEGLESTPIAEATTTEDTTAPPTPTFVTPLGLVTGSTISMTANAVTDPEGTAVLYRFTNVTNSTDSGWISSPTWTSTGLDPLTEYFFTVESMDSAVTPNTSAPSAQESATTLALPTGILTDNMPIATHTTYPVAISVTPGEEGFASSAGTGEIDTAFNNPVLDYAFFGAGGTAYASGTSGSGGGSRISDLANPGSSDSKTNLWETSSTAGAADYTAKGVGSSPETGVGDWSVSYSVPDTAVANNPGVTVIEDSPSGFDTVTLTVPMSPDASKFARLKVVVTP